jgi:hypothetical protein
VACSASNQVTELESHSSWHDDSWIVIITAEITPGAAQWASTRLDEHAGPRRPGRLASGQAERCQGRSGQHSQLSSHAFEDCALPSATGRQRS